MRSGKTVKNFVVISPFEGRGFLKRAKNPGGLLILKSDIYTISRVLIRVNFAARATPNPARIKHRFSREEKGA